MVQYETQEAVEGTPQGENGLKNAAPNDTRFRRKDLSGRHRQNANRGLGNQPASPQAFAVGI